MWGLCLQGQNAADDAQCLTPSSAARAGDNAKRAWAAAVGGDPSAKRAKIEPAPQPQPPFGATRVRAAVTEHMVRFHHACGPKTAQYIVLSCAPVQEMDCEFKMSYSPAFVGVVHSNILFHSALIHSHVHVILTRICD